MTEQKPIAAPGDILWYIYPGVKRQTCPTCGHTALSADYGCWLTRCGEVESICWDADCLEYSFVTAVETGIPPEDILARHCPAERVFLTEAEAEAEAARRNAEAEDE